MAIGYCSVLTKSFTVISPRSRPSASTSGSFSILCLRSSPSAASAVTPTAAVTSGIGVMTSRTGRERSISKRMSRLVMIPSSRLVPSVTGTPEIRNFAQRASASNSVASGRQVTGSVTIPASERLTISTWAAWSSAERLRCSTPIPPWRAIAMAIRASVTVSIALETSGIFSATLRVSWVVVSASLGTRSEASGSSSTSS